MPWKRKGKCVYKKNKNSKKLGKKQGCSTSISKAKKYLSALYANSEDVVEEIKDYFNKNKEEDYLEFDNHPLSSIEDLMDPSRPAPWDHLNNDEEDEDIDIEIEEHIKK